jgi:multiple sugar transport system ATP-binding protein
MASVELQHVEKVYPNGTRAVGDCSLTIDDGELMVFVGPSGCGKSTLLRMVAGLEEITRGTLRIGDRIVNDLPPQERNVAMVFQDYALYPFMSVEDNLAFPLKMRRLPRAEMQRRIHAVAALLDIRSLLDRLPKQLSGGQRQRVAMGRALVREPTVFLLDEPLSNLDAKLRVQVRAEIADLQQRTHTTMIYVTHDQVEAMTLGHRVAVMNAGRLQQVAAPRALYDHPVNVFVAGFIGNPPMNLVPATVSIDTPGQTTLALGDQRIALPSLPLAAGRVTVGIRPEAFGLAGDGREPRLRAVVEHVEWLGHETLAYVRLGDDTAAGAIRLVVRLQGMHELANGHHLQLQVEPDRVHLFAEDGRALTAH